jgi:hypothetical protein
MSEIWIVVPILLLIVNFVIVFKILVWMGAYIAGVIKGEN